ncbi:MAG: hypothetical protein WEA09_10285 [Gemmatimonadota bacterium]
MIFTRQLPSSRPRHRRCRSGFLLAPVLALTMLGGAESGSAQVSWDAPLLVAPTNPGGLGLYLLDTHPGDGVGFMGVWRPGEGTGPLGYRVGVGEGFQGRLSVFGGVDIRGSFIRATEEVPVEVVWVAGAGLGVGDGLAVSFPLGLSAGSVFQLEEVALSPFISPRVVLDAHLGDDHPRDRDGLTLGLAVDLGVDISMTPDWTLRFGAVVGDRSGLAIGVHFPGF